tara:strand:- start:953 stop:3205 length:2253 start_codon:yes stop_codon:yes gene_type:complete
VKKHNSKYQTPLLVSAVLVVGLLLSSLIYWYNNTVFEISEDLVKQDAVTLRKVSQLQNTVLELNNIDQEYQTTKNKQHFLQRHKEKHQIVGKQINEVLQILPTYTELKRLSDLQHQASSFLVALEQMLSASFTNKKQIDSLLGNITANSTQMSHHLRHIDTTLQKNIEKKGTLIRTQTQTIFYLVILFAVLLFVVSLTTGHYIVKWSRFVAFPERNPNPVFALDEKGMLRYSNPGATRTATSLGLTSTRDMLPTMLEEKLAIARSKEQTDTYWEYKICDQTFTCLIRYQPDLKCYHIYLTNITKQKSTEEKLQYLAFHDVLTELPNRLSFENMLKRTLEKERTGAILLIRLDSFRFIVEALGYTHADQALIVATNRLSELMHCDDLTCHIHRFEGDVFAILIPNISQEAELDNFTQRITDLMQAPFILDGRNLYLSLSIGISTFPDDGNDLNTLLHHADMALQQVKRAGGNNIRHYLPEMGYRSLKRLELLHELKNAEKRGEFELHYQPQFDTSSKELTGIEALIRWNHPERGMILPAEFIPIAEETDIIIAIGEWVLTTACKQNKTWQDAGLEPLVVAVNLSPHQFQSPELQTAVQHSLKISGLASCWLDLELTESAAMHNADIAATTLNALKSLGVKLSIDDFGTGYSSLAYLKRFPIDKLKIDKSFVHNMTHNKSDAAITKTIITLGHNLGLKLIAEGVENYDQLAMLKDLGCEGVQGYLFAKPQSHTELSRLLEERKILASKKYSL